MRNVDGPAGGEVGVVDHLALLARDLDHLAGQESTQLTHVGLGGRPRQGLLVHHEPPGEPRADRDRESARCHAGDGGDGRRGGHHVAQARNEHCSAEPDPARALGDEGEVDPDVLVDGRRVVEPHALEAELLGEHGEVGGGRLRRETDGDRW